MSHFLGPVFGPGFFTSSQVHLTLVVGGLVAVASAIVGVFAVVRGQAFASEALSDVGAAGASGASLVGAGAMWGFLAAGVAAAGAMEMIGVQRPRGRDLATGVVLGASLGLAALFLYLDTTEQSTTGLTVTVLFGSLTAVAPSTLPAVIGFSLASVGLIALIQRPLLTSSLSAELAAARGIPVRLIGAIYLLALALAVALAALTIGAVLATALLVGPAATALRLVRRPATAIAVASAIGLGTTWLGIVLAYDSYDWPPRGQGWPVSFFIVAAILACYLLSAASRGSRGGSGAGRRSRGGGSARTPAA